MPTFPTESTTGTQYRYYQRLGWIRTDANGDFAPFINTLGGDIVFSYDSTGFFIATLNGVFLLGKTYSRLSPTNNSSEYRAYRLDNNSIELDTTDFTDNGQDGILFYTPFEIEIYP
jgi:hypothetical protein